MFRHRIALAAMALSLWLLFSSLPPAFSAPLTLNRAAPASSVSTGDCAPFSLLPPYMLAAGRVGTGYRQRIKISDPTRAPQFKITAGRLPHGLRLDNSGQIIGTPVKQGRYQFTILAWLSCATHANRVEATFTMAVSAPVITLSAQTRPESIQVAAGKDAVHPIRHLLKSTSAGGLRLHSSGGRFMAGGRIVGRTVQPITVNINGAAAWAGEILTIRSAMTAAALRSGARKITYVRDFTAKNALVKVQTRVDITIASAAGPGMTNQNMGPEDQAAPAVLPGQIVVTAEASPGGRSTLNRLSGIYSLKTLEMFEMRTLKQIVAVFVAKGDVNKLIKQIRKEHGVIHVQPNRLFQTYADPQDDLQHIYAKLNLQDLHRHHQGNGTRVAILDTGVDIRHPDLKDRIVQHANLIRNNPYRAEIHGTAVAGVVAASINGYGISGIAPKAELIALRACWQTSEDHPEGRCTSVSVSKALDTAIESDARIVNMSLGAAAPDPLMMQLLDAGAQKSILFVAPVGNHPSAKAVPFPASHSKVLAVGGIDAQGGFFPNAALATAADVCAPAGNIFTTIPGNTHNFMNGTSLSAAIVTGILAVAKEKNSHLGISTLPAYKGDLCRWQERLLNLSLCNARPAGGRLKEE
ncbi:MAG: S8 family serine peptidase [Desulfobacteraceae bacterium]